VTVRNVLVLRRPDHFTDRLKLGGFNVINLPVTATEPVSDLSALESYITELNAYDGCFFTSPVAAQIFVKAAGSGSRAYAGKIYVLGERTKQVFEKAGIKVEYRAGTNTARELVAKFPIEEFLGRSFLFVCGELSMRTIPEMIGLNATVDEVVVYRTIEVRPSTPVVNEIRKRLASRAIDWVCFFSPSAVDSFVRVFALSELSGTRTAGIGETTGRAIKEAGLPVNFTSSKASAGNFAAELLDHIKSIE
jgi:uroporphyrinogen-III synthase